MMVGRKTGRELKDTLQQKNIAWLDMSVRSRFIWVREKSNELR